MLRSPVRNAPTVAILYCFLWLLPSTVAAQTPLCDPIAKCVDLWGAVQNVGDVNSLFTVNSRPLKVTEIYDGQVIEANQDISVRNSPADWTSIPFKLRKGAAILVKELRSLSIERGGTQVWVKIGDPFFAETPSCDPIAKCVDLWVAAQNVGDANSLFAVNSRPLKVTEIHDGQVLEAIQDVNVRNSPADWTSIPFKLPRGGTILVKDLTSLPIEQRGTQLWVKIGDPTTGSAPPTGPGTGGAGPTGGVSPTGDCFHEKQAIQFAPRGSPFDRDGLIMHDDADFGDTAQREGWYWLGVWIRQNKLHQPWIDNPPRQLSFDDVLKKLEPNHDGVFVRAPGKDPYGRPTDGHENHGTTRDQLVPLIAAMAVWGKREELQRLWNALPEDWQGKHDFQGHWHDDLTNEDLFTSDPCKDIKNRGCAVNTDCSRGGVCGKTCVGDHCLGLCPCEERKCESGDCTTRSCHTECPCGTCGNFNCRVQVLGHTECPCGGCGEMNCRTEVCIPGVDLKCLDCDRLRIQEDAACSAAETGCTVVKKGEEAACEANKIVDAAACELKKIRCRGYISPGIHCRR